MFCKNCGTKLRDGAAFCPNCGTKIITTAAGNPAGPAQQQATPPFAGTQAQPQQSAQAPQNMQDVQAAQASGGAGSASRGRMIAVIAGGVLVLAAAVGAVVLLTGRDKETVADGQDSPEPAIVAEEPGTQEQEETQTEEREETQAQEQEQEETPEAESEPAPAEPVEEAPIQEDVNARFMINSQTMENYTSNLDPSYYQYYDSGYDRFTFYYPTQLYNNVTYNEEPGANGFGTNVQTVDFTGSAGSELRFSLIRRNDGASIEDMTNAAYDMETAYLTDAARLRLNVEEDHGIMVVTGYNAERTKLIYDLVRVEGEYVMQMLVIYPSYTSGEDKLQKDYVTECYYRMCGFSGSSDWFRSYEDYRAYWEQYL